MVWTSTNHLVMYKWTYSHKYVPTHLYPMCVCVESGFYSANKKYFERKLDQVAGDQCDRLGSDVYTLTAYM